MLNPFSLLEKYLYKIRDFFWNYPDKVLSEHSFKTSIASLYKATIPYSHIAFATFICFFVIFAFTGGRYQTIFGADRKVFVEAVVMGTDPQGRLQRINKVNPIVPSNIQLEKDLTELIYEPLIKYEYSQKSDNTYEPLVQNILASEVIKIKQGADYQFNLKRGVLWHDGVEFTSDDVIATLNMVSKFQKTDNAYIRAIKQMRWEKIGPYSLRLCTKDSEAPEDQNASCSENQGKNVLANFLELVSIKIMPAHKIKIIRDNEIETFDADIYRSPIGTGKYKFYSADNQSITLDRNEDYIYTNGETLPTINSIRFKFYKTLGDAVQAIQNGEAHSLTSISEEFKKDLEKTPNIKVNLSPVLDNQYWGVYFNLKKDPNGNMKGPAFFGDVNVRRAISSAISRYDIIQNALVGVGEEAFGPITQKSEFFNKDAGWFTYDPDKARTLLETAGWVIRGNNQYRTNDKGEELKFSMYFVNSFDRLNVARVIQKNLADIGIHLIIDRREQPGQDSSETAPSAWTLDEINREILAPRSFDTILYGMNTFIDPDRFELFDSTQQNDPGLNIASYVGSAISKTINPNRTKPDDPGLIDIPKVDKLLQEARTYDPEAAKDKRKRDYDDFQIQIAEDSPVIYLYHPQFIYYTNSNLQKIALTNVSSVEDRFRNIENWELK